MLDFKTPSIADKELIEGYTRFCGQIGCDISFANTYLWRDRYRIMTAFDSDTFYKCYAMGGRIRGYSLPITKGDIRRAADNILEDARERGIQPMIGLMNKSDAERLQSLYKDRLTAIREDRDAADYIYEREKLAQLAGKKYHAKRNHISRFERSYPNHSFKELCKDNFDDAFKVVGIWQDNNEDTGETAVIKDAFGHFEELGMFGLVMYVGSDPVAMCMASEINDRVCDVNFEKAVDLDGAYAMINREFARRFDKYTLINREEDMGVEGLRKAKLSYHPDILYTKNYAVFKKESN